MQVTNEPPPATFCSSESLPVEAFEQILWLPLRLNEDFKGNADWTEVRISSPSQCEAAYAEYLYFHPSIRAFLWGDGKSIHLHRWQRNPADRYLDLLLPKGQSDPLDARTPPFRVRLKIISQQLFTFGDSNRVGILQVHWKVMHVEQVKPTLAEILDLLDAARRTHPGYFPFEHGHALNYIGGRVPIAAHLHDVADAPFTLTYSVDALQQRKSELLQDVEQLKTPMFPHWAAILGTELNATAQQIEDERMPYMAYLAVENPAHISPGDWVRIAFADYRGDSSKFPYAADFLPDFKDKYCYDRYFDPKNGWTTRILNSGYAFTMVGSASPGFFRFDARDHFERHYAKIGLLLQYNKAALLNFSKELADASSQSPAAYSKRVRDIQGRLVQFTHRHWFDGFTNQVQGHELSTQWSDQLGLGALYQSVMNEARLAHEQVLRNEEKRQSDAIEDFTVWGLRVGGLGLLVALAGAGFPFDAPFVVWKTLDSVACLTHGGHCSWNWVQFFATTLPYVLLGFAGHWLLNTCVLSRFRNKPDSEDLKP